MAGLAWSMASPALYAVHHVAAAKTTVSSEFAFLPSHRFLSEPYRKECNAKETLRRRVKSPRAAKGDEPTSSEGPTSVPQPPEPSPISDRKAAAKAEVQKGQSTAIITGAVSVLLGVGYLVLLQLLDTRGVNLIPPPPEAFDP